MPVRFELGQAIHAFLPRLIAIGAVLILAWVALRLLTVYLRRSARANAADQPEAEKWAEQVCSFLRRTVQVTTLLVVALILLRDFRVGVPHMGWDRVDDWIAAKGLPIVFILVGAWMGVRIVGFTVARLQNVLAGRDPNAPDFHERRKRIDTIGRLLRAAAAVLILGSAGLMALNKVGVNIAPLLTGAGVAGLAVGFGAQNLVRDVISGLFMIMEDQIRVGDVATINGKGGLVEAIRLRTTVLRAQDGTVHIFPNGSITQLSNSTKDYSRAVLNLGVAYKENTDAVCALLRTVGDEFAADPAWAPKLLGPLEVLGVNDFADSAVIIQMQIKTLPIEQWSVARELRRRLKLALDRAGIEMPFPHLSIYMGEASRPFAVQTQAAQAGESS